MDNKKLKVLQINACYGFLSTGIIMRDIGEEAEKNGFEMYYAYQQFINHPEKNGFVVGNKLDRKIHAVSSRVFGRQGYASKGATKKLTAWIDSVKPDVVHLHNLHSNYINLNMLCDYLSKNNIATILTLHDCWFFTGKCSHYAAIKCDKWQTSCGNCPQLKNEVPSLFGDCTSFVLKDRTSHLNSIERLYVAGCSEWISGEAAKSLLKPKEICTITNGVDLDIFKPDIGSVCTELGLDGKFVILGMANKWLAGDNKEAFNYIVNRLGDDDRIIIVGCNDEQKQFLSSYSKIVPIGFIKDREELAKIYASSDVFVNLTHADTLPTVNMESIACGTPVITYNCCGSGELVHEGCGYVVDENDYEAVWQSVCRIKNEPCKEMLCARSFFDKNENYKKYIRLYKKAAEASV